MDNKIKNLIAFSQGIYNKENGKELYNKYLDDIQQVTPQDVFLVEYEQLQLGLTPRELLSVVDKLINVFYHTLKEYSWERPLAGSFLYYMMEENKGLLKRLDDFKVIIKRQDYKTDFQLIKKSLEDISTYNNHLLKLENIVFPYMEKRMERFEGLKIMWSLHDDVTTSLKSLIQSLGDGIEDVKSFNVEIGSLFFVLHGLVQKQELILFPSATEVLDPEELAAMHIQSFDYEFVFIEQPAKPDIRIHEILGVKENDLGEKKIHMETGVLSFEQIENMINVMPVDITFVDANDKVAFFSRPVDRIFPRSVAIIGRDVRNCHPPESVHIVEKILADFKSGQRTSESFWLKMRGLFLLIQYFVVRNNNGDYLGTLEVSQEISEIRSLEGEKRLLDE